MEHQIQLDVIAIENNMVTCNMQTGERDVRIKMHRWDYETLVREGFFTRPLDGPADGAGCLNTTLTYSTNPVKTNS